MQVQLITAKYQNTCQVPHVRCYLNFSEEIYSVILLSDWWNATFVTSLLENAKFTRATAG